VTVSIREKRNEKPMPELSEVETIPSSIRVLNRVGRLTMDKKIKVPGGDTLLHCHCDCGLPYLMLESDWGKWLGCPAKCHALEVEERHREQLEELERRKTEKLLQDERVREEKLREQYVSPHYESLSKEQRRLFKALSSLYTFDVDDVTKILREMFHIHVSPQDCWGEYLIPLLSANTLVELQGYNLTPRPYGPRDQHYGEPEMFIDMWNTNVPDETTARNNLIIGGAKYQPYATWCDPTSAYKARDEAIEQMNKLDPPPPPETPGEREKRQFKESQPFPEMVAKLWNLQPLKPFLDTQCITADDANEVEVALIGRWSHYREELAGGDIEITPIPVSEFLAMLDKAGFERYSDWRSDTHKRRGLRLRKVNEGVCNPTREA
jgi:hypothetical protein